MTDEAISELIQEAREQSDALRAEFARAPAGSSDVSAQLRGAYTQAEFLSFDEYEHEQGLHSLWWVRASKQQKQAQYAQEKAQWERNRAQAAKRKK